MFKFLLYSVWHVVGITGLLLMLLMMLFAWGWEFVIGLLVLIVLLFSLQSWIRLKDRN